MSLSPEIEALLDAMEPEAKSRFLRGATTIDGVAQVSMAVSMRRIADVLTGLHPTMIINNTTSFKEMSPEQIIEAMSRTGHTHPEPYNVEGTALDPTT